MNVALEEAEEYVGGQITNKYGDVFIRANNGEWTRIQVKPVLCFMVNTNKSSSLHITGVKIYLIDLLPFCLNHS